MIYIIITGTCFLIIAIILLRVRITRNRRRKESDAMYRRVNEAYEPWKDERNRL
jgi:hypothetical protein